MSSCFDNGVLLHGADCVSHELEMRNDLSERQRFDSDLNIKPWETKETLPHTDLLAANLVPPIDHTLPDFKPIMPESEPVRPLIDFKPIITDPVVSAESPIGTNSSWLNRFGADTAIDVRSFHERRRPDTSLVDFTIKVTPRYEPPNPLASLSSGRSKPSVDLSPPPVDKFQTYNPPTNPFRSRDDEYEFDPLLGRRVKKSPF